MVDQAKPDGRRTRGARNRELIVQAVLEFIHEGVPSPTAEMVSERAGVGLRTVFRHFEDMDTLYCEVTRVVDAMLAPVLAQPVQGDTPLAKLQHALERRSSMFERLLPVYQATQVHLHQSAFLQQRQKQNTAMQRALLIAFLPADMVRNTALFEALDLLLSIETWARLRHLQGLTAEQAKDTVMASMQALLAAQG